MCHFLNFHIYYFARITASLTNLIVQKIIVGGLGLNNELLICGGKVYNVGTLEDCYTYQDNEWVVAFKTSEERYMAAISRTPGNGLLKTGGTGFDEALVDTTYVIGALLTLWLFSYLCLPFTFNSTAKAKANHPSTI